MHNNLDADEELMPLVGYGDWRKLAVQFIGVLP